MGNSSNSHWFTETITRDMRRVVEEMRGAGSDVVLVIDVQGASKARALYPEAISIFILPPSRDVLVNRLQLRGANPDADLRLRLRNAHDELDRYRLFDYLVINDDLERATVEMTAIVRAERCQQATICRFRRKGFGEFFL